VFLILIVPLCGCAFIPDVSRKISRHLPIYLLKGKSMGPYICTRRCKHIFSTLCAAFLFFAVAASDAAGQAGKTNSTSGQAVLHIQATVVPSVMLPTPKQEKEQTSFITYNMNTTQPKMTMIEEVRPLPRAFRIIGWGGNDGHALLKTLTVVAQ
jgi:hypothetical protein